MKTRQTTAQGLEKLGILLCNKNPDIEPVLLSLREVQEYVNVLGNRVLVPQDLDEGSLQAIRFAWGAEFLDRTV